MAGDPNCIAERLMGLELRQPTKEEMMAASMPQATAGAAAATAEAEHEAEEEDEAEQSEDEGDDDDIGEEDDEDEAESAEPDDLNDLIDQLTSDNRRARYFGAQSLRRRLSDRYEAPAYSRLLISPALAALVTNLDKDSDQELQFESAWALTNLLAGSGARPTDLVASSGLAKPLIRLLQSATTDRLREQACWALANVAGESPAWRDQLLAGGDLLTALIALWDADPNNGLLDASSLLLVNLFRDREPRIRFELAQRLLPPTVRLLRHPYESVVPHVVWALSYAIEDCEPRARLLLREPDAVACLSEFLDGQDDALLVPTLRLFCGLSACLEPLPACLIANGGGILTSVRRLLDHNDAKMRRQALLFFGNVSGGPDSQLEAAAQAGCLAGVGRILAGGGGGASVAGASAPCPAACTSDLEKREAFWIVPNFMLSRGHKFSKRIIDECLEGFLEALNLQETEISRCVLLCVRHLLFAARYKNRDDLDFEALKRKMEACGGLKKIEMAQKTDDKELVKLSYQIIDQFFWGNEKKYMEDEPSQEASPSPADSEIGDDLREGESEPSHPDKDALSSLIGGLQARD